MSGIVSPLLLGGFGGQLFQYCFARAYAEKYGLELRTPGWVGQEVFDIPGTPPPKANLPGRTLFSLSWGEGDVQIQTYATHQRAMIYTRTQARAWFKLRPRLAALCESIRPQDDEIVAHRRTGDYIENPSYPVISRRSYVAACHQYGHDSGKLRFVEYETPLLHPDIPSHLAFLPDFWRLLQAPVLFRGNSAFSWWAALLGDHCAVYSPDIRGLKTGVEQDAPFVPGNAPRIVDNHDFVTDLEVAP